MTEQRWQLLPDLIGDEFASLKASIVESGVLIPPIYDAETHEVVDGHQRLRAVAELRAEGVSVPEPVKQLRRFGSDEERIAFVIAANVQRRRLSPSSTTGPRGDGAPATPDSLGPPSSADGKR